MASPMFGTLFLVLSVILITNVRSLDNGLALVPPMGWLSWERFRCKTDCDKDPKNCISENLIKEMADAMVSEGYKDAGYEYVIIDDCWMDRKRGKDGRLRPDPKRFPSGIKSLADYVHSKGLKFGIYADFGVKTCAGYPGSEFYLQMDADTFAEWGVDCLKLDGCNSHVDDIQPGYEAMGFFLNRTGRPIVYSCSWPYKEISGGKIPDYEAVRRTCNLWRNHRDIHSKWSRMIEMVEYYDRNEYGFSQYAGPGGWNDPDMLVIGNKGLKYREGIVQMVMWSIMASPLIMSNDLRNTSPRSKALLQNKHLIRINQDPLGVQGTVVLRLNDMTVTVWKKPLSDGSHVIAILNTAARNIGSANVSFRFKDIGLSNPNGYDQFNGITMEYLHRVNNPDLYVNFLPEAHDVSLVVVKPVANGLS